ncbi:hypothetical protein T459_01037 [Capsicum annuum]|uniref:Uncharacterized protein n=1 Tax=Capsicum annuum TaxID=4072 RepID=A0A2G3AFZ0_CAPAN|nr:Auxin-induced protein 6B [Capsicum annuum]PHT93155.1 hypothetical protein T459_01037 [Capsicum annuum]
MVDPIWDIAILRDTVRALQRQVNGLQWELAALRARMLREIRRLKRVPLLPVDDWSVEYNNSESYIATDEAPIGIDVTMTHLLESSSGSAATGKELNVLDDDISLRNVNLVSENRQRPLHLETATQIESSVELSGIANLEWIVGPPVNKSDAIPFDATVKTMSPLDLTAEDKFLQRKVFLVLP